ncbi:MAG: tryptophan synthase subunit alpha [Vampirovibrionales bacterium]|nr:tryptophan synthase subunit alpha [Vampirovibrionales bacterium]
MTSAPATTDRYAHRFGQLAQEGRAAFIPFTLLGWPTVETSRQILEALMAGGADALELGLPFSDPMADGPVLQQAATEALAAGARVDDAFALIAEVRAQDKQVPIGLMAYYNMILARGADRFCADAAAAGVDAILVPDLPPETAGELAPAINAHGLSLAFIVSPLTDDARLDALLPMAGGFLYIVSRLGVTGVEARYDTALQALAQRVKAKSSLPACIGFGISTPADVRQMTALGADGVITGSAVIQRARESMVERPDHWQADLQAYIRTMADAVRL